MANSSRPNASRTAPILVAAGVLGTAATIGLAAAPARSPAPRRPASGAKPAVPAPKRLAPKTTAGTVRVSGPWQKAYRLKAGETVEIAVRLEQPSALPANGRLGVEWVLDQPDNAADVVPPTEAGARKTDAHGIYTAPTANWRKVLHALDGSVYLVYRAPVAGSYLLKLAPVTDEKWVGDAPRWREKGVAPEVFPLPAQTPWPAGTAAPVSVSVDPVDFGTEEQAQKLAAMVEAEPNDTPEQAQSLDLVPNADVKTYEITGTSDDIEYFDNGAVGRSGDDWFRVRLRGTESKLVTAQLGIPGQFVAGRIRCYVLDGNPDARVKLGGLLPVSEHQGKVNPSRPVYTEGKEVEVPEGKDPNERAHQQEEEYRINISRIMEPGKTYFFRVEANAPAYQLQLRVLPPSPYQDPRMATRQAMYTHIGQVDAWLSSRPRGATIERRIRDSGNLLGTQCMSCHTQSGLWGPAVPIASGYQVENVQSYWHLQNIMYECLRPTNELKDAANNTSLAPLDIGDGPAGTRAAGFAMVNLEGLRAPRKLHSKQQLRTANFMLLTKDPTGINAAGPGSNIGQNIVWLFATEILNTAWKRSGDPKYFRAMEEKARNVLALNPRYTDDVGVRIDYFSRVFRMADYAEQARKAAEAEKAAGQAPKGDPADVPAFVEKVKAQLAADEARLRAIQNPDGSWGFNPGRSGDGGKSWKRSDDGGDPSPTALAVSALAAMGYGKDDPAVVKGVQALLRTQDANGRWNKASITGFVPTAYVLRALGRLYPVTPRVPQRGDFVPKPGETNLQAVRRVQALALTGDPKLADLMLQAARHPNTLVRYWAMVGLGATHTEAGVPVLIAALRDRARPVRDTAAWALRQTLLDDRGWAAVFAAYDRGDDYTREGLLQALAIRADAVMPQARLDWDRLTATLERAMNDDPHPAVRAYASKAAWQWWVWNPPVRAAVNRAWVRMLERPEPSLLVENNNRYSSQALFIANGHKANGSSEHQYKELATLFEDLRKRLEASDAQTKSRMARRLVAAAGTFYQTSGGDGGPGQMGYVTPGAGALFGQAVLVYMREAQPTGQNRAILAGLEGAANVPHRPLQEYLIDYTLKAPEELRQAAAAAVSDPRSVMLQAATELVEPLITQVKRGAAEPPRRPSLSDPVIKLFGTVNWVIPADQEQQRHFFDLMVPKLDQYVSPQELAAIADPARKAELEREMDAAWYLADRLGEAMASNPDLHQEIVFRKYFPESFKNPLERHFWVRSVPWLLMHKTALPEVAASTPGKPEEAAGQQAGQQKVDPALVIKDRALQLYLDALKPAAPARTREAAIRISNQTAVRQNPEVLLALTEVLKTEKDPKLVKLVENVVKQGTEKFVPELVAALKAEMKPGGGLTADGTVDQVFLQDMTYFRDYVIPELARAKRSDQASCMGCHSVPGRVPSFFLKPVDEFGYISPADLLFNYREMQTRVNLKDLDRSKILRKPLNVQDGKEDGHQGGRRYTPSDEGYLILKKWVENQTKIQGAAAASAPAAGTGEKVALLGRAKALRPRLPE